MSTSWEELAAGSLQVPLLRLTLDDSPILLDGSGGRRTISLFKFEWLKAIDYGEIVDRWWSDYVVEG